MTPTATHTPFDTDFLDAQREQLVTRRAAYVTDLENLSAAAQALAEGRGPVETTDEDGFGEVDSLAAERSQLQVVAGSVQGRLDGIALALARMEAGSYGLCEDCGQAIAAVRLEVLPEAARCVSCKSTSILRRR